MGFCKGTGLPVKNYWYGPKDQEYLIDLFENNSYATVFRCKINLLMIIIKDIDRHINNFTALSVVGVLQYAFLPLAL